MTFALVLLMAFVSGFVSLSYEVLWARMFSWSAAGAASSFPMLLGLFLAGLAVGAKWSKRFSHGEPTHSPAALRAVAGFFGTSALAGWLVIPGMALLLSIHVAIPGYTALYCVFIAACLSGAQLPLLMHYGIEADGRVGANLSYVYVSNIFGAVAGSMLTGFLWLDHATTDVIVTVLTVSSLVLALALWMSTRPAKREVLIGVSFFVVAGTIAIGGRSFAYDDVLERLFYGASYEGQHFKYVVENKSGIITIDQNDVAYGGGVYDGTFSVEFVDDVNGAARPYSLSAFHEKPSKVLFVGLATGSWARIVAAHPQVERLVIVEINPGYYEILSHYPVAAKLLESPNVELIDDDGRRWLNGTDEKFDAIIINASFHQRGFGSALLSKEFMELAKAHLNPKGILMLNTTGSQRVLATACDVMPGCVAYLRSAFASPDPITPNVDRLREVLLNYKMDGHPIMDPTRAKDREKLEGMLHEISTQTGNFKSNSDVMKLSKGHEIITDDNMGHEWQFSILGL